MYVVLLEFRLSFFNRPQTEDKVSARSLIDIHLPIDEILPCSPAGSRQVSVVAGSGCLLSAKPAGSAGNASAAPHYRRLPWSCAAAERYLALDKPLVDRWLVALGSRRSPM